MKRFFTLVLFSLLALPSLFAVTTKDNNLGDLGDSLKPIQTVFLIMKIAVVVLLLFMLFKTIFSMWQADPQQRGSILMKNMLFIVIGVVILLAVFNIPKLFKLDNIISVDNNGSAVIRITEIDKNKKSIIDEFEIDENGGRKDVSITLNTTSHDGYHNLEYIRGEDGKNTKQVQKQWVDIKEKVQDRNRMYATPKDDVMYSEVQKR